MIGIVDIQVTQTDSCLSYCNVSVCLFVSAVIRKEEEEENTTPNVRIFKSPHMSAKITFKEHFVPYSTRFLELFRTGADDTSGRQNNEK